MNVKLYLLHLRRTQEERLKNNFELLAKAIREVPATVEELKLKSEKFQRAQDLRN
jgi:hypothetical protein